MIRKSSFDGQSNDLFTSTKEQSNTRSEAQKERVSTACTYCRYRKVKCDGGKPSCGFCVHMGRSECVYAKVSEEENQHLRRRKRELRARRAAERIRAEQEQRASSQSPSSTAFILNPALESSSPQTATKRRRSSVPKRSREISMASSSVTSTPNIFSSSAPSQINQEFPPEMALSGLPAELTNTFSPDFLNLLTPQSNATIPNVDSRIDLGGDLGGNNAYTFPSTSMTMNNSTFDVNASNLDWTYSGLSSSAPAASSSSSSMLMDQRQEQEHFQQLHQAEEDQKAQMAPPRSIFALAASDNSFLGSMTGTFELTIPDFKGPTLAMSNLRPSNEVQGKAELEDKPPNCFRQQSKENHLNQIERNDPLFTDMQVDLQDFNQSCSEQEIKAAKRRFSNITEETQAIYSLWPTSSFHPDQSKRSSVPFPNEPSSMPELKRFLCTTNNPFSFNPVMPLAMSVNSSERNLFNIANFAATASPSSL